MTGANEYMEEPAGFVHPPYTPPSGGRPQFFSTVIHEVNRPNFTAEEERLRKIVLANLAEAGEKSITFKEYTERRGLGRSLGFLAIEGVLRHILGRKIEDWETEEIYPISVIDIFAASYAETRFGSHVRAVLKEEGRTLPDELAGLASERHPPEARLSKYRLPPKRPLKGTGKESTDSATGLGYGFERPDIDDDLDPFKLSEWDADLESGIDDALSINKGLEMLSAVPGKEVMTISSSEGEGSPSFITFGDFFESIGLPSSFAVSVLPSLLVEKFGLQKGDDFETGEKTDDVFDYKALKAAFNQFLSSEDEVAYMMRAIFQDRIDGTVSAAHPKPGEPDLLLSMKEFILLIGIDDISDGSLTYILKDYGLPKSTRKVYVPAFKLMSKLMYSWNALIAAWQAFEPDDSATLPPADSVPGIAGNAQDQMPAANVPEAASDKWFTIVEYMRSRGIQGSPSAFLRDLQASGLPKPRSSHINDRGSSIYTEKVLDEVSAVLDQKS